MVLDSMSQLPFGKNLTDGSLFPDITHTKNIMPMGQWPLSEMEMS